MADEVSIGSYGPYKSPGYGAHCMEVRVGSMTLYFSYRTVVAFSGPGSGGRVVSENCWGTTTGKHLNAIDGGNKKARLKRAEFEALLSRTLKKCKLSVGGM